MTLEIKRNLALARQLYQELTDLSTIDRLLNQKYGHGPKRQRIQELVMILFALLTEIEQELSAYLDRADDSPIMQISMELRDFYANVLEPNCNKLRTIFLDITGLRESLGVTDWQELRTALNPPQKSISNAMNWALERWWNMLEKGEQEDWLERGFNIEAALDIIDKGFFAPDKWLENQQLLRPVLVDRPLNEMPKHVQDRFREIYYTFTYGLWMSAICLSRSVSEFAIIDNGPRLGLDITCTWRGKECFKTFESLIDEVTMKFPKLNSRLEKVRIVGNRILHPKKKNGVEVISFPKVEREESLECIKSARLVVERLYSTKGASFPGR
jgi:hypothetical protein